MWIYTEKGFFSVVQKPPCNEDELLVRARHKGDIEKLHSELSEMYDFDSEIIDTPKSDYAFRMVVSREIFALYMFNRIMRLNYDNFKDMIPVKDFERHDAYFRCWEAMYNWQRRIWRKGA